MADREAIRKRRLKKKRAMLLKTRKKVYVSFVAVIIVFMALGTKIFAINYTHGDEYSQAVLDHQTYTSTTIPYRRGQISTSDGSVLAYSEKVYNLILDVKLMNEKSENVEPTLTALSEYFGLDRSSLDEIVSKNPESQYAKLAKELKPEQIAPFQELMADKKNNPNIVGVWFEESYIRSYPMNNLACDVVGFASSVNGGELGIELQYNDELIGTNGVSYSYVDEELDVQETQKAAVDGNNIVLTLDYNVQSIIEKHIIAYNEEKPSLNTAVMVMDPNNGEILGMASYPYFNLNSPRDLTTAYSQEEIDAMTDEQKTDALFSLWTNFCVSQTYEPGSVFKTVTVASGLEEGVIKDGDTYECKGYETVSGYMIKCHIYSSRGSHGVITLEEALMNSCNPWMINIATKIGAARFAQYQELFGFGNLTQIDLPGETTGITYGKDTITEIDADTNAFGQNINVNMVQMLSAYSSIINGGYYYQPHVVKRIEASNGEVIKENGATLVKQTVTSSTSKYLRQYLEATVSRGTGHRAGVEGYSVAGKTGTAQKTPREDRKWLISFIGHAPADDPKFAIYVIIDEPDGTTGTSGSSGDVLTLTHDILSDLLPYMNVFMDSDDKEADTSGVEESPVDISDIDNGADNGDGSGQTDGSSNTGN
ncbi:MAG: peptidoglycan D,D-transpeptidase FtsI family protein [Lachnospira sp.]